MVGFKLLTRPYLRTIPRTVVGQRVHGYVEWGKTEVEALGSTRDDVQKVTALLRGVYEESECLSHPS